MFGGVWPSSDWDDNDITSTSDVILRGSPLCLVDEFFCVVWRIKGDIVWYGKDLKMKFHSAHGFCDYCVCAKEHPDRAYWPTNFATDAPWKPLLRDRQQWRDECADSMHMPFKKIIFVSRKY